MANTFYPVNDAEFAVWLANLVNKAAFYSHELNLTNEQIGSLQNKLAAFNSNIAVKQQKKEESIAQTALVMLERKDLNKEIGLLNNGFKAIGNLAPNILEEIGLNINDHNFTTSPPSAPTDLVVTGTSDGTNHLKWKRNASRNRVTYIIEAKIGISPDWVMVDAVTSSRYEHRNQTPGVKAQYRVRAKRAEFESGCSNTAVVYG